jgi:maleylpyruvate isomerase
MATDVGTLLAQLRSSTAGLLAELDQASWTDEDLRKPSLVPTWTRGHVLTHLARNADAVAGTLTAAARGERREMYPAGREARNTAIEAGSPRPIAEQLTDVRQSAEAVERACATVAAAGAWDAPAAQATARNLPWVRIREVEIHRVDLRGGYQARHWPAWFLERLVPEVIDELAGRSSVPLRIAASNEGSGSALAGRTWTVSAGEPVEVTGPDWALLAWLVGRPDAADHQLSAMPPLEPWR